MSDVISSLAGLAPGGPIDRARDRRAVARAQAQLSYGTLFAPADCGTVSAAERFAVAVFVARLHGSAAGVAHYEAGLAAAGGGGLVPALREAATSAAGQGPYGAYPAGPLSAEDVAGPVWRAGAAARAALGARLAAALAHTHMLVFHPRDAAPAHLRALLDAGWSTDGIVTLSQLVAFLAFQLRVAAGLAVLAAG